MTAKSSASAAEAVVFGNRLMVDLVDLAESKPLTLSLIQQFCSRRLLTYFVKQ